MNAHFDHHHPDIASPDHTQLGHGPTGLFGGLAGTAHLGPPETGPVVGDPASDAKDWVEQTTGFTCDVVAQEMILHEFGVNVSETELVHEAIDNGWLTNDGTSTEDMGRLLDLHGVPYHVNTHGAVEDITNELAQGHKIIVGVYADELWQQAPLETGIRELLSLDNANHAIVVTGLDMSDPSHPKVVVNDPGVPDGAGKVYPLDQFLEAWSASGDTYVATDFAPPNLAQHLIFGANYHPESGMYMDKDFWGIFLKALAFDISSIAAQYVVSWASGPSLNQAANSGDPGAGRNGLF